MKKWDIVWENEAVAAIGHTIGVFILVEQTLHEQMGRFSLFPTKSIKQFCGNLLLDIEPFSEIRAYAAATFLLIHCNANQEIDHGLIPEPAFVEVVFASLDDHQLS